MLVSPSHPALTGLASGLLYSEQSDGTKFNWVLMIQQHMLG